MFSRRIFSWHLYEKGYLRRNSNNRGSVVGVVSELFFFGWDFNESGVKIFAENLDVFLLLDAGSLAIGKIVCFDVASGEIVTGNWPFSGNVICPPAAANAGRIDVERG